MRKKRQKNENKPSASFTERMLNGLDLPADAAPGNAHIEILGSSELWIDGHHGVLAYSDNCVKLSLYHQILVVEGEQLVLRNLTPEAATVTGVLSCIRYER